MAAPLDETLLLLNIQTGHYHGLNSVAARIWGLLAEPSTLDRLTAQLTREFAVSEDDCRREVADFLVRLDDRGLLSSS
jgi:hypothetical protein